MDQLLADEQVTSTGSAGNVLWALSDNLGSIRDIADLSGSTTTVTNHRRFGAYGNLASESNAAVDMLFAFTGKLYDEVTGHQNNLNRWYDGKLGQWLSEDPIGFEAGDANVRRYVGNVTSTTMDPSGLIMDVAYPKDSLAHDGGGPPNSGPVPIPAEGLSWNRYHAPHAYLDGTYERGKSFVHIPGPERWSPVNDYGDWANQYLPDWNIDDALVWTIGFKNLAGASDTAIVGGTILISIPIAVGIYFGGAWAIGGAGGVGGYLGGTFISIPFPTLGGGAIVGVPVVPVLGIGTLPISNGTALAIGTGFLFMAGSGDVELARQIQSQIDSLTQMQQEAVRRGLNPELVEDYMVTIARLMRQLRELFGIM